MLGNGKTKQRTVKKGINHTMVIRKRIEHHRRTQKNKRQSKINAHREFTYLDEFAYLDEFEKLDIFELNDILVDIIEVLNNALFNVEKYIKINEFIKNHYDEDEIKEISDEINIIKRFKNKIGYAKNELIGLYNKQLINLPEPVIPYNLSGGKRKTKNKLRKSGKGKTRKIKNRQDKNKKP